MSFRNAVSDLSYSRLLLVLGLLGFTVLFLSFSEDIIHWKDLSEQVFPGNRDRDRMKSDDCLSRSQQMFYRSSRLPSSKFLESWQRYGEMHKSCSEAAGGNWRQILNSTEPGCKYLIYVETNVGLGNRLLSLVSALVYALLTDRVLMLDSRKEVGKLLCEPFQGSSWLLPDDFPYEALNRAPNLGQAAERHFEKVPLVHLYLNHIQTASDRTFFCDEVQAALDQVRALAWNSNQYYVTGFLAVPSLWRKLVHLFPNRFDIFAQVTSLAVSPKNRVWSLITRYYNSYLSASGKLVGVQIRPHGRANLAEYDPAVYRVVLSCLTGHRLLPGLVNSLPPGGTRYEDSLKHRVDVSVLVASLQGKYYESLKDVFLRNGSVNLVNFQMLSNEGAERHDLHQSTLALVEMWLLSFSDQIVTSGYSTFGYIAHAAASKRPWIMNIRGTSLNDPVSCYLGQSTEPCTHFPQKPSCRTNLTDEHREWIRVHVGGCQDQLGGLQLFSACQCC